MAQKLINQQNQKQQIFHSCNDTFSQVNFLILTILVRFKFVEKIFSRSNFTLILKNKLENLIFQKRCFPTLETLKSVDNLVADQIFWQEFFFNFSNTFNQQVVTNAKFFTLCCKYVN
eukprot:TRINITY_DN11390_c0_g1_i1.p5 TRINITY_DN11390_c0_g1~~TRINITY_DN11390_c0_g1_i1.p5  ORF type:complete len:117 (-),score=5.48 TRINITY_DN11390_c0_g1_i1:573-923(-)